MKQNQTVVITGASAGVGRATAIAFARQGSNVALIARGEDGLDGARRDVEAAGGRALVLPLDVADADAVEAAAERAEQTLGPIDVWVNNAMCSVFSPVADMKADEYQRVTNVTYLGGVYGTLAALRRMKSRDRGTIVQVGSALAYRSIPLQSAYCAAKHALAGFTDSLRSELIHDNSRVKVTMVDLPAMNTPQFGWSRSKLPRKAQPVPPIYQPEVAAQAIVHSVTHHRRQWFIGAPTVAAVVAQAIAPGYADWHLGRFGYDAQQRPEAEVPGRADNLFAPLPGDRGARGDFTSRSHDFSLQYWADKHRTWLAAGAVALSLLPWVTRTLRKSRGSSTA